MNYPPTRHLSVKRDILPRIRKELPDPKAIGELFAGIHEAMLKNSMGKERKKQKGKRNE